MDSILDRSPIAADGRPGPAPRAGGGAVATAVKFAAVFRITLASRFAYLGEMALRTIFLVLILFTFTQLWRATNASQNVQGLTGFNIARLIWYLAFTEAMIISAPALTENEVDREVRSGDIVYRLTRPLSYPLYHLASGLGDRVLRFLLNLLVGGAVAWLLVGPITLSPIALGAAVLAALLAFVADWTWSFSISLLSFWIEDTFGLHLLYRRLLMLLGGMLLPLEAYPRWLGRVAHALPFQYLVYRPARLFVQADASGLASLLGVLLLIILIGLAPLLLIYRLGGRRLSAQGG